MYMYFDISTTEEDLHVKACCVPQTVCDISWLLQDVPTSFIHNNIKGAFVWEYSGIRMYSGIYSGYSAPGSRIARMESRYSGMRIAPTQMLTCIIPIILIPD